MHAEKHTDRVYHLHDFRLRTEPIESDFRPRNHSQTPDSSEPCTLSQSEHDWAYAKRALTRGDDPEEIIRRIADYRADEKHNPAFATRDWETLLFSRGTYTGTSPTGDRP